MKSVDTFSQIKDLLQKIGGRYIIVENGRPVCVVATLEDYQALISKSRKKGDSSEIKNLSEVELIEKINQDILLWKEAQEMEKAGEFICGDGNENESEEKVRYVKENEDVVSF